MVSRYRSIAPGGCSALRASPPPGPPRTLAAKPLGSFGAVVLAVVSGVVRPAVAVEVSGRLEIDPNWSAVIEQRVAAQPNPGPPTGFWQVGNGAASVDPLPVDPSQEIGLLIRPVEKRDMDPTASGEPVIEVRNVSFQPAVAYVADGMKLLIRNSDLFDHEFVVEDERGEALPLEPQEGGRAFRVSFKARGQYVVRCRLFPFMRAYVVVEAPGAARFVRPDQAGRVSFGDLAPGRYAITVFNATQIAATAPNPIAGWVASPCSVDVPEPLGAQPPPVQPGGAARGEAGSSAAAATATPQTVFHVTVRLGRRGADEVVECSGAWPATPPAAPAAGQR